MAEHVVADSNKEKLEVVDKAFGEKRIAKVTFALPVLLMERHIKGNVMFTQQE